MKIKELKNDTKSHTITYDASEVIGNIALDKTFDDVKFVVLGKDTNEYMLAKIHDEVGHGFPFNIIKLSSQEPLEGVNVGYTIAGIAIREISSSISKNESNELVITT